jgi:AhpD family alkylhydroperoxidase
MEPRLNLLKVAPKEAYQALAALQQYVEASGLERPLVELVKIRASQINGCAYCIDMHTKDARALGESEQRIYLLNAWRESPFYTDRERAALEWTESVTLISETHAPDDVYERVKKQFTPEDLVNLTLAIVAINGWNRVAIPFRSVPGQYQSHLKPLKASA